MLHKNIPAGDVHTVANWEVADAAALNALVPVSGDDGKIAWRQDNNALYLLVDYTGPTWAFLGSGAAPGTHASSHQSGGSDPIKLDDLAAPDDNTDLNASTTAHGLLVKATAPSAGLINVVGIGNGETAYTNKALFDATTPAALASAAATGSATVAARRDHVHAVPKLDDCAAPDDNTDLNVSITAHGLAPKAPNVATQYLDGTGAWSTPAGVSDHGGLTGLSDDDHTQYLLASGLREWDEQAGDPSTPAASKWKLYFKAGGAYIIDDAAVVTGPLGTGGGSVATDSIWDAAGDLVVGTGANTAARLAIGANGYVLTSNGTTAAWAAASGGASNMLTISSFTA